jgi:hypothetical protein
VSDALTIALLLVAFAAPLALYGLSRSARYGPLRGSAIHPFNVAGFVLVIMALDLAAADAAIRAGLSLSFAGRDHLDRLAMTEGLAKHAIMAVALVLGVALAARGAAGEEPPGAPRLPSIGPGVRRMLLGGAMLAALGASSSMLLSGLAAGDPLLVAGSRQVYLRHNPLQTIGLLALLPAFTLFAAGHAHRAGLILCLAVVSIVVMLPTGSRVTLLFIGLAAATALAPRLRVQAAFAYLVAPVVVTVLLYLRYLRGGAGFSSFAAFIEAQGGRLLFAGPDLTFAEALVMLDEAAVPRWPGETFLAMLLTPVPRAVLPWKPEGPSMEMTRLADPQRWAATKSEWLTTGFMNLLVEFGPVLAPLLIAILAYAWARALTRVVTASWETVALRASILSIVAVQFLRTDLYNLSLFLWSMAGVLSAAVVLRHLMRSGSLHRARDAGA